MCTIPRTGVLVVAKGVSTEELGVLDSMGQRDVSAREFQASLPRRERERLEERHFLSYWILRFRRRNSMNACNGSGTCRRLG
jgi:hypothetical protein